MNKRTLFAASAVIAYVLLLSPAQALAADCQFVLGFSTLKALIDEAEGPEKVGECLENQHSNPANGDALQQTTGGLMAWRKADNWTAFTDGYRTWINGPNGLEARLNTEQFEWETGPEVTPQPTTTLPASTPIPAPTPVPDFGEWLFSEDTDALTKDTTYSAYLRAYSYEGGSEAPGLYMRCGDDDYIEVFVWWRTYISEHSSSNATHHIRYRVDDQPIRSAYWNPSTNGYASFSRAGGQNTHALALITEWTHSEIAIEVLDKDGDREAVGAWLLAGASAARDNIRAKCGL